MTKTVFQINDTVRCIKSTLNHGSLFAGKTYKVRGVSPRGSVIQLEGYSGSFSSHRFELVSRVPTFKLGDLVRFSPDALSQNYAFTRMIPLGKDLRVSSIFADIIYLGPYGGVPARFLIAAPKPAPAPAPKPVKKFVPHSIKLDTDDVMAVLSKHLKDTLGLDVKVERVTECFGNALELEFAK